MYQFKPTEGYPSLFHKKVQLLTAKVTEIRSYSNLRQGLSHFLPLTARSSQLQAGNVSNLYQPSSTLIVSLCRVAIAFSGYRRKRDMLLICLKEIKTSVSPSQLIFLDIPTLLDTVLLILGGMAGWCQVRRK